MTKSNKRVAIIGGGLVGTLNACCFSQRGFQVDLYESRDDMREQEHVKGRSINLALSLRGREALRMVGQEDTIVSHGIPMYGRMIHNKDGTRKPISYGKKNQCIMSVDRRKLNELLLTVADKHSNTIIYFNHKLVSCNLDMGQMKFQRPNGQIKEAKADLIIGNDGAHSAVRRHMMKLQGFNYTQEYIPHAYMELSILPTNDDQFAMETNYLHIWPRETFMLIALPNQDKSFTATLFMPWVIFERLDDKDKLLSFFDSTFHDAVQLIGKDNLLNDFFKSKPSSLVSIKCNPYHVGHSAIIMGDAAHAMVPFFGQGMNCGFEDVLIFHNLLIQNDDDFAKVLPEFSKTRHPDAVAICDLAMYNYIEMRDLVTKKHFILRKYLDNFLYTLFPKIWIPLYTMVTFSRMPYSDCVKKRQWQDKIVRIFCLSFITFGLIGTSVGVRKLTAKVKPFKCFKNMYITLK